MLGIISKSPCEAVNVVASEPVCKAPCIVPAAPASLCISTTKGTVPQIFGLPSDDHESAHSPMGVAGVIGYIAITSLSLYATEATASLPSMVAKILFLISSYYPFLYLHLR